MSAYSPMPLNARGDVREIARQEAMAVFQSQALLSSVAPGSFPQNSIVRPFVTELPVSAGDKDEVSFLADATNGVVWRFRFRANAPSKYQWEFLGGSPLYAEVTTSESTSSTSYAALATAGPSIALPLAGDYMVSGGAKANNDTDASGARMSYDIGSTGAVDGDALAEAFQSGATSVTASGSRSRRKTDLTAVTLTAKYKATVGGNAFFSDRWLSVIPIRVGRL